MDYSLALQEIQNWIKDLIIIQYRQSKRNRALIDLIVKLIFANCLILQIRDLCLNVEKSIGAQLVVVGKWVNLDKFYNGMDLWNHPYVSYPYYTTIQTSAYDTYQGEFSNYKNFEDNNGGFLMYKFWQDIRTAVNQMGDDYFRALIKLKIIYNSINHTRKSIDEAIWQWSEWNKGYSDIELVEGANIYADEKHTIIIGKVSEITDNNIIIKDNNNITLYNGYYNVKAITDEETENISYYIYTFSHVYITWENMQITYNHDETYRNIMILARYKDILPRPIGCNIVLREINND